MRYRYIIYGSCETILPSDSACCKTIPKYVLLTNSGFTKNEFRLNHWDPIWFDAVDVWVCEVSSPKRRRVNQCCSRFRMNASWFL